MDKTNISQRDTKARKNRDARSFKPAVALPRDGKPCRLKRHFRGVAKEVVGYLQMLAKNHPSGFCAPRIEDITAKARVYVRGQNAGTASERSVKYAICLAKEHGVVRSGDGVIFGKLRQGYYVARHDDIATSDGAACTLKGDLIEAFWAWFDSQCLLKCAPKNAKCAPQKEEVCTENGLSVHRSVHRISGDLCTNLCTGHYSQREEKADTCRLDDGKSAGNFQRANLLSHSQVTLKETLLETPGPHRERGSFKKTLTLDLTSDPSSPRSEPAPSALRASPEPPPSAEGGAVPDFFQDWDDEDSRPPDDEINQVLEDPDWQEPPRKSAVATEARQAITVREKFGKALDDAHTHLWDADGGCHILAVVSGFEFEPEYLQHENYAYTGELLECVAEAVKLHLQEPFGGRKTLARIMADAMERMRDLHDVNVPTGWYRAIKRLRGKETATTEEADHDDDF